MTALHACGCSCELNLDAFYSPGLPLETLSSSASSRRTLLHQVALHLNLRQLIGLPVACVTMAVLVVSVCIACMHCSCMQCLLGWPCSSV